MLLRLAVALTVSACAVKECDCGGTLLKPEPDLWLCYYMIPPGMEHTTPDTENHSFTTLSYWYDNVLFITVSGSRATMFYGYMLQVRVNGIPSGTFQDTNDGGIYIDCLPYSKVRYINFASHVCDTDYRHYIVQVFTDFCALSLSCTSVFGAHKAGDK